MSWRIISADPAETRALGCRLGRIARPGLVVLLAGDLGAGKTCFAQGVAEGLGTPADIPVTSPTYALLNVYPGRLPLYHFDLYRLDRVDDLAELGYDEVDEGAGVTLVEWPERLGATVPAALQIRFSRLDESRRELRFEALDQMGRELIAALA